MMPLCPATSDQVGRVYMCEGRHMCVLVCVLEVRLFLWGPLMYFMPENIFLQKPEDDRDIISDNK